MTYKYQLTWKVQNEYYCGHLTEQSEHTSCVLSFPLQLVGLNPLEEVTYTMPARLQILQRQSIALSTDQKIYM
jgi:hypothetical protein